MIGAPELDANAAPNGGEVVLDAKVGEINQKAVMAGEFLEPLQDRLRTLAKEARSDEAWRKQAGEVIFVELYNEVKSELLLAEARANLSKEQRQGLVFFLDNLRDNLKSLYFGSEYQAEQELQRAEGITLEKKAAEERDKQLVQYLVSQKIQPLVQPTKRDVERYYQKNIKKFRPDPRAKLRIVRVNESDEAAVAKVTEALASGMAFEEVAALEENGMRGTSGEFSVVVEGEYSQAKLLGVKELNAAAQGLSVGEVSEALRVGGRVWWVKLEAIEQETGRSLEEVQLEVLGTIRAQKVGEETERYFATLIGRASVTNLEIMADRLLRIAHERFVLLAE